MEFPVIHLASSRSQDQQAAEPGATASEARVSLTPPWSLVGGRVGLSVSVRGADPTT